MSSFTAMVRKLTYHLSSLQRPFLCALACLPSSTGAVCVCVELSLHGPLVVPKGLQLFQAISGFLFLNLLFLLAPAQIALNTIA